LRSDQPRLSKRVKVSRTCLIPLKWPIKRNFTKKITAKGAARFHSKDFAALLGIIVGCAQQAFVITAAPNEDYQKLILSCTIAATCATSK
jgi:hypothetical protein